MIRHTSLLSLAVAAAICMSNSVFAQGTSPQPVQRVLVMPFAALNVPDSQQWISKGVQEDIVADFGRSGAYSPMVFQSQVVVEDNATAARLARQASAPLAVRGSAQMVGDNVRLTAQLIDAKTGDTVSTASVTGPTNDLLRLEDQLSGQLRGVDVASNSPTTSPAPALTQAPNAPPAVQSPQVIIITPQGAMGYDSPYASNPYTDSGYGYPGYYPGLYPGVIFTSVFPNNFRGRDHGHDGDHGHGGGHIGPIGGTHGGGTQFIRSSFNSTGALTLPLPTSGAFLPIPTNNFGGLRSPSRSFSSFNTGRMNFVNTGRMSAAGVSGRMSMGRVR